MNVKNKTMKKAIKHAVIIIIVIMLYSIIYTIDYLLEKLHVSFYGYLTAVLLAIKYPHFYSYLFDNDLTKKP